MPGFWSDIAEVLADRLTQLESPRAQGFGEYLRALAKGESPFLAGVARPKPAAQRSELERFALAFAERPSTWPRAYLPIESFRALAVAEPQAPTTAAVLKDGQAVARRFLSSGTTAALRSQSLFSAPGLALYHAASLVSFFYVVEELFAVDPRQVPGISLIPTVQEWPDSSLAQMVAWIAEMAPVRYATEEDFADVVRELGTQPLWVFGTAFHYINLIDSGKAVALPKGSALFETGGTKGRSREVTRQELFALLRDKFALRECDIASEYGMCELASQAYDWLPRDGSEGQDRAFRFPAWVRAGILTRAMAAESEGEGMLVLDDPLRVDFPMPLRTEDLAALDATGKFQLLGRAKAAPLKGCSLGAEIVSDCSPPPGLPDPRPITGSREDGEAGKKQLWRFDAGAAERRAAIFLAKFRAFLQSGTVRDALTSELESSAGAAAATQDLIRGLPESGAALRDAAWRAIGERSAMPARWLYILPQNHGVVGCYPLALAYVLGLAVTVRVPQKYTALESFLSQLVAFMASLPEARIARLESTFTVSRATDLTQFDAILCYGSNATLAALRQAAPELHLAGFGDRVGVSITTVGRLADDAQGLVRDLTSLAQTGCMATRLVIAGASPFPDEKIAAQLARTLQDETRAFWRATLSRDLRVGQELEAARLRRLGAKIYAPRASDEPLIALISSRKLQLIDEAYLIHYVAVRPFVMPILIVDAIDEREFVKTALGLIQRSATLKNLTCAWRLLGMHGLGDLVKSDYGSVSLRELGAGNAPRWNGMHEGRALFDVG